MDAVKYLKGAIRMCDTIGDCQNCPLGDLRVAFPCGASSGHLDIKDPERVVKIVEKWSAEHPEKTRQSEFLKMFPNAVIRDSYIDIKPCEVDTEFECPDRNTVSCGECKQRYWHEEVE